ncbi:MAG: hypothetical protein ACREJR_00255 [Candidatus Rokuibacteriota bacterium]
MYGPKAAGAWPGSGTSLIGPAGPGLDPNYLQVSDTSTQSASVANTLQDVTWSTNGAIDGFTHTAGAAQIVVARTGVYQITASIPVRSTLLGGTATVCVAVNGVTGACQSTTLDTTSMTRVIPLTTIVSATAADVVTLRFKGSSTSVQIIGTADSMSVLAIANVD